MNNNSLELVNYTPPAVIPNSIKRGRPAKSFADCGVRSRSEKAGQSTKGIPELEILQRATDILKGRGMIDASVTVMNCMESIKNPHLRMPQKNGLLRPEVAIAAISDSRMTTNSYIRFRKVLLANNANILPSYKSIKKVRAATIPNSTFTENTAEIKVQDLLNVTTAQLIKAQNFAPDRTFNATLLSKWGMDGSGGHSTYRQNFRIGLGSDSNILSCQLVPLQLQLDDDDQTIIWKNPAPNSNRLCRPIFIKYN